MFKQLLLNDNIILGIILGILLPLLSLAFIYLILYLININIVNEVTIKTSTIKLISIFTNLFSMRYYLLKLKFDKTGRGILLSTTIFAILFFIKFL